LEVKNTIRNKSLMPNTKKLSHMVLLGGHLTPALALGEYVQATQPEIKLTLIGRQYSQDRDRQLSHEAKEAKKLGVSFIAFEAPRVSFHYFWEALPFPFVFIKSIFTAIGLLRTMKPDVVVSFGSYLAVPVSIASWLLGIPVVTHEQTKAPGQATAIISKFAKKIAVTFPEVYSQFPAGKTEITGTPIRTSLFSPSTKAPEWFKSPKSIPMVLILGGNQGSSTINHVVGQAMPQLTENFMVVHQCGNPTANRNYKAELERLRKKLPEELQSRYVVAEWFGDNELGWLMKRASLVVSRSGANTVYELAVLGTPSILIPLPSSRHQEQHLNAQWLSQSGGAILLPQKELSPDELVETIRKGYRKRAALSAALANLNIPTDGAKRFYDLITTAL
jgi:UDP-N-acetylglucosamine--N-acetylmuramyl-(pentapeptide) pyrophosphoryl-undecaprenol N-acetylglucosamine transferase